MSTTKYFLATFAGGIQETRSSPTRAYVKASRYRDSVSFHMTMDAGVAKNCLEVVPATEITGKEYRALKAAQLAAQKAPREEAA